MKLKIEGNLNSEHDIVQQILDARGISRKWLTAGQSELHDGSTMRNFQEGYDLIEKHKANRVVIIVD